MRAFSPYVARLIGSFHKKIHSLRPVKRPSVYINHTVLVLSILAGFRLQRALHEIRTASAGFLPA